MYLDYDPNLLVKTALIMLLPQSPGMIPTELVYVTTNRVNLSSVDMTVVELKSTKLKIMEATSKHISIGDTHSLFLVCNITDKGARVH